MGIFEVFYAPGKLFASLPERRRAWIVPMLLNCLLFVTIIALQYHYVGRENVLRRQLELYHMPADRMEEAISRAMSAPEWRSYIGPFIGTGVFQAAFAGLLLIFAIMSKNSAKYVNELSLVCFAYFPYALVICLMTALILIASPDPGSLDMTNLIATNVGAFLDKSQVSKGLYALASSIDLLSFAEISLLAYAFSKVNQVKLAYGFGSVLALWAFYVCIKMALSSLF